MGAFQFKLPDIGEGTAEAEIVAWHVKVGDKVKEDQPLVDMMTDKATVELSSPVDGIVTSIGGEIGKKAAVGSVLVTFTTEGGADLPPEKAKPAAAPAPTPAPVAVAKKEAAAEPVKVSAPAVAAANAPRPTAPGARPAASPAVRRRADELGIKLQFVPGTGPQGRITHGDLDTFVSGGGSSVTARGGAGKTARNEVTDIPVIGMRRQIAERMQLAKRQIPHFTYVEEVDMTAVDELRTAMNAMKAKDQPKLTVLPFFMMCMARALEDFPQINALYDDEAGVVHRHAGVHIGMAAQTDKGLMVPVVRHVEARDIWDLAVEIGRLATAARDGKAKREELSGSTITLTSLGTLGGVVATPVINRPEVGIICPNKIIDRPVVKNGQIVVRKMMNLSSSFDHRVVDGADAAAFIQRMKILLEQPALIFMP
jgi:2-oxoisovalerate dehydrogenase E2 component (dihydrolipoyl transacylase)